MLKRKVDIERKTFFENKSSLEFNDDMEFHNIFEKFDTTFNSINPLQLNVDFNFRKIPVPFNANLVMEIKSDEENIYKVCAIACNCDVDTFINDLDESDITFEDLVEIINKKTGITEQRWVQKRDLNHWFDCESMNLAMAIMLGVFTPSFLDNELVTRLSKESVESTVVSENKS